MLHLRAKHFRPALQIILLQCARGAQALESIRLGLTSATDVWLCGQYAFALGTENWNLYEAGCWWQPSSAPKRRGRTPWYVHVEFDLGRLADVALNQDATQQHARRVVSQTLAFDRVCSRHFLDNVVDAGVGDFELFESAFDDGAADRVPLPFEFFGRDHDQMALAEF